MKDNQQRNKEKNMGIKGKKKKGQKEKGISQNSNQMEFKNKIEKKTPINSFIWIKKT